MADVCAGLHAAHELEDDDGALLGVVHRDVSPQNVLVSTRGVAKLIDFGVAKARDRLSGETHGDTLKGKVQYMPPEQALGLPVDRRADVWAVGAVLHHLITGKPPFEADNEIQTIFMITSGRRPSALPSEVPACVRDIVKRALSHSAEARYSTAAELQQALEDAIVETRLAGTTSVVAAFVEAIAGDRAEKRKEAIALGLKAAEDRENVAAIMRSNAETAGAADTPAGETTAVTEAGNRLRRAEPCCCPSPRRRPRDRPSAPPRSRFRQSIPRGDGQIVVTAGVLVDRRGDRADARNALDGPRRLPRSGARPRRPLVTTTAAAASPPSTAPTGRRTGGGGRDPRTPRRRRARRTRMPRPRDGRRGDAAAPAAKPRPAASSHRGNYGF